MRIHRSHTASCVSQRAPFWTVLVLLVVSPSWAQNLYMKQGEAWTRVINSPEGVRMESASESQALPLAKGAGATDLRQGADAFWLAAVEPGDSGPRMVVFEGQGEELERMVEVPGTRAQLLREPSLLAGGQGLEAVLWLESDQPRQQTLLASRWMDGAWQAPVTVAPVGPGSQGALDTAVLSDGTWLAVWAAFDGQDSEIVWSRAVEGQWSKPQPVVAQGNQTPDITPRLHVTPGGGALVAWSRFDGDAYRVVVSRFEDGTWALPRTVGGRGSLDPAFQAGAPSYLLYRQLLPEATWEVMELDGQARLARRGRVSIDRDEVPLVESADEKGALLSFSGGPQKAGQRMGLSWTQR